MGVYNNLSGSSVAHKIPRVVQGGFLAHQLVLTPLRLMGALKFLLRFGVGWSAELTAFKFCLVLKTHSNLVLGSPVQER